MTGFYERARKAVHGALVALLPVEIPLVSADASVKVMVLAGLAALVGVGGTVYATTNKPE